MKKKKRTKRVVEKSLKRIDISKMGTLELIRFAFTRKSFYRDYKLLYNKDRSDVETILGFVLFSLEHEDIEGEVRVCYKAAIEADSRYTFTFNSYLSSLVELYFSNVSFSLRSYGLEDSHLLFYPKVFFSFDWVLSSNSLSIYSRYLLFEYLVLGYSIRDLAKRRYCTDRTIQYHLAAISEDLGTRG